MNKYNSPIIGYTYTNDDLCNIFKVAPQGGMRRSHKTNSLVLIVKHGKNIPYEDNWNEDGTIDYTGMQQKQDQSVNYRQNKTLAESNINGVDIYLFESFNTNSYVYRGPVELIGTPFYETQKGTDNIPRKVVKFKLRLKGQNDRR